VSSTIPAFSAHHRGADGKGAEETIAILRARRFYVSLAGGTERHFEVESLCFLEMIDHVEKIASLRIAAGT
jgi:hypothetical protein